LLNFTPYTFGEDRNGEVIKMNQVLFGYNKIAQLEHDIWEKLKESTESRNINNTYKYNNLLTVVQSLKKDALQLLEDYETLYKQVNLELNNEVEITITPGALKENYFYLGSLKGSPLTKNLIPTTENDIMISSPIGDFKTRYLPQYNRFRDRKYIRRLYETYNLTNGDIIIFKEIEKNKTYKLVIKENRHE
jgi:hypothetical protein